MSQWPQNQPLPAEPLTYSAATYGRTPGLITTIGVFSISIAGIGLLFSLVAGLITFSISMTFRAMSMRSSATSASAAAVVVANDEAISQEKRTIIIDSLAQLQPLNAKQRGHLETLLKEDGESVILLPQESITADAVRRSVSKSAQVNGRASFAFGNGNLSVSDTEATFEPVDGGETIHAVAESRGSSDALAKAAIARIEALTGTTLNPAQVKALTAKLTAPGQTLLSGKKTTSVSEINGASAQPDGTITMYTGSAWVILSPTGSVQVNNFGGAVSSSPMPGSEMAIVLVATLDTAVSLALAVFLLVAGIVMVRRSPRGRTLHWIYVMLKIPISIAAVAFWAWQAAHYNFPTPQLIVLCAFLSMGLIYPLSLIIALSTKTVRDYYSTPSNVAV